MNFDELANSLSPDTYSRLRAALELGRWPTGQALTKAQKSLCLEAIIKYEISHNVPAEQRTGYVQPATKPKPDVIPGVNLDLES